MTLAQGLAEYYAANPASKRGDKLSPRAREFFRCHDIVHVVYGCGTTMREEAVVKLASVFGTSGGLTVLRGYLLHESRDIYRKVPLGGTVTALLAGPYLVVRTIWRCVHQSRRWPWDRNEEYMDQELGTIRERFRIKV